MTSLSRGIEAMNRRAFLKLIRPDGWALVFFGFAVMIFLSGIPISIWAAVDKYGGLYASLGLIILFFIPVIFVLLFVAAIISRRAGPRFAMGVLTLFLALVEPVLFTIASSYTSVPSLWILCLTGLIFCFPAFFVGGLPIFLALPKLPKEIESVIFEERCERVILFLQRKYDTMVLYRELSEYLKAPEAEVDRILAFLLDSGQIQGTRRSEHGLFFTQRALERNLNQLLALVESRAQISFDELAEQLGVPPELVHEWVVTLVGEGRYSGYIHWEEKVLYSREAQALHELERCPQCGGELRLAGKGVVHCKYCGNDIFLEETNKAASASLQQTKSKKGKKTSTRK